MLQDLITERAKILTQATDLAVKVKTEGREDLSAEERGIVDRISVRAAELETEIAKLQADDAEKRADRTRIDKLAELAKNAGRNEQRRSLPPGHGDSKPGRLEDSDEYRAYFNLAMQSRFADPSDLYSRRRECEQRGFTLGTNTSVGYMSLPTAVQNELVSAIDELSGIASMGTRQNINGAKTLGITTVTARGDDADWTGEVTLVNQDATSAIGRRDFTPTLLTKGYKASMSLIQRSPEAVSFVFSQLARLFAVTMEKAALTGTGSAQPLGIFVASANGISTGRDIECASQTVFTYAELLRMKYAVKDVYRRDPSFGWIAQREFVRRSMALLDNELRPIFQPSNSPQQDDLILGIPVRTSEFAPNTYTLGLYVAVLGAMKNFWWVDSMNYTVQVLDQLYAATNEIGYIGRAELDGGPMLEEAFARLQMKTS